jgi:hypothetical protein
LLVTVTAFTCENNIRPGEKSVIKNINALGCEKIIKHNNNQPLTSDPFIIEDVAIENSCLKISVSFGGGCGDILFQLYQASEIMESFPPQMDLYLKFTDDDHCKALIFKDLEFDLSSLVLPYNTGTIRFNLEGYKEAIEYNY